MVEVLGSAGLPSAPSSARCLSASGVAHSFGPPNRRGFVGGLHDRLAECAWKVPMARPVRGVVVRSKDDATQENICGQYWVSSGVAIRMDSEDS